LERDLLALSGMPPFHADLHKVPSSRQFSVNTVMPLYEYRCEHCGHQREFLQKRDAAAPACPACGAGAMGKLLSAAGFQLKGSGWYASDFKGGSQASCAASAGGPPPCQSSGTCPGAAS